MNVDARLEALFARAVDPAASEEEARTSAVTLLRLAKKHGRRVVFLPVDAPEPVPDPAPPPRAARGRPSAPRAAASVPEWFREAMGAAGRAAVDELRNGALDDILDAIRTAPSRRATKSRKR